MNNLINKLQSIPLVKSIDLKNPIKSGSLFFGVGLMTSKQIGVDLPFDILGLFFATELIHKALNFENIFVVLGDTHANSNQLFPETKIKQLADKIESGLNKIVRNFALQNFQILSASQFQKNPDFQKILNSLPEMDNQYLKLEIADCLWLKEKHNLNLKVGWTMSKANVVEGNDERFFDNGIRQFIPDLNFIHLEPGWTFNPARPRVSPYISIEGENRLELNQGQKVADLGQCQPHLAKIVRCAEILWGKLPQKTLEEKVQFLLDKAVA